MSNDLIQCFIVQPGQRAERIGVFTYPLPDRFRYLVGQQEQLFFIGVENVGEFVDELFRRVVAEVKIFVLDLRDVRVAHADFRRQITLRQPTLCPKLPNSFAKVHFRFARLIACVKKYSILLALFSQPSTRRQ